jgi:hypothetical protein
VWKIPLVGKRRIAQLKGKSVEILEIAEFSQFEKMAECVKVVNFFVQTKKMVEKSLIVKMAEKHYLAENLLNGGKCRNRGFSSKNRKNGGKTTK